MLNDPDGEKKQKKIDYFNSFWTKYYNKTKNIPDKIYLDFWHKIFIQIPSNIDEFIKWHKQLVEKYEKYIPLNTQNFQKFKNDIGYVEPPKHPNQHGQKGGGDEDEEDDEDKDDEDEDDEDEDEDEDDEADAEAAEEAAADAEADAKPKEGDDGVMISSKKMEMIMGLINPADEINFKLTETKFCEYEYTFSPELFKSNITDCP